MSIENVKIGTEILTAWFGVAALIVGGWFAGQQYLDKKEDDRIRETLNFLDRYNAKPYLDARQALDKVWMRRSHEEDRYLNSKSVSGVAYNKFLLKVIREEKLENRIDVVTDFYSVLAACVAAEICDQQTAVRFFRREAVIQFERAYPYILVVRKYEKGSTFGMGLERIATLKY